jgi:hypothetical protein
MRDELCCSMHGCGRGLPPTAGHWPGWLAASSLPPVTCSAVAVSVFESHASVGATVRHVHHVAHVELVSFDVGHGLVTAWAWEGSCCSERPDQDGAGLGPRRPGGIGGSCHRSPHQRVTPLAERSNVTLASWGDLVKQAATPCRSPGGRRTAGRELAGSTAAHSRCHWRPVSR